MGDCGCSSALEVVSAELGRLKKRVRDLEGLPESWYWGDSGVDWFQTGEGFEMWYDMRVGGRVQEKLGLDELKQQLANVLEGGAGHVEVAPHGALPSVKKAGRSKKS